MGPRKELRPEDVVAICDTREQRPYDLAPFRSQRSTLETGDYSILGYEDKVTIERKSLDDFIGSISQGRDRFEREIDRLLKFESKMILVEASADDIDKHRYLSRMYPTSVMGTIAKYQMIGIPVMLASSREIAQDFARRFLFLFAKHKTILQPVANSDTSAVK